MPAETFKSFSAAMNAAFGKKPGQSLQEFMAELKELTADDRAYFTTHLATAGFVIDPA